MAEDEPEMANVYRWTPGRFCTINDSLKFTRKNQNRQLIVAETAMAKDDVFVKPYVDERDKNNLEGLLEQLNLPPTFIAFVKRHQRTIQVVVAVVVVVVIAGSWYGSYRENKVEQASAALAEAVELDGQELIGALSDVEDTFSGTDAALWASIGRAQELARSGEVERARQTYLEVREEVSASSPLSPLLTYGIALTSEVLADFDRALAAYETLKTTDGFSEIGYLGLGRVYEMTGQGERAVQIYEEYLASPSGQSGSGGQRGLVEEKIVSIKATL
jgi:predicted negative regulator of RcsB-dependent stress response